MENLIIPYHAAQLPKGRSVLVLAPHSDDEVFGCGGVLALHAAAGARISIMIMTDGAARAGDEKKAEIALREDESRAAAEVLGLPSPVFWRLPDRGLEYGEALVGRIGAAMAECHADLVYAPSLLEIHPDHCAAAMSALEAVRRQGEGVSIAFYEVGQPGRPNCLVDITEVFEKKRVAMRCFASQLKYQPYDEHIAALNRYRSYTLPREVLAVEAFELLSAETLRGDRALDVLAAERDRRRTLGVPSVPSDFPLVSVLIRSMDRPPLGEALNSVSVQTYPHIEIVLVNALGKEHRHPSQPVSRFPVHFLDSVLPRSRSEAANVAVSSACGRFCLFLDDDDLIAPDHVSRLVAAVLGSRDVRVAYTGVEALDASQKRISLFDDPFSAIRLVEENYLPIHAVLFERALFEEGCRFDQSLDVYEDWDFWLQLSRRTDFRHVPGVSATYRIGGGSDVGLAPNVMRQSEARKRIYEKWSAVLKADDYEALYFYHKRAQEALHRQLHELGDVLDHAREALGQAGHELDGIRHELEETRHELEETRHELEGTRHELEGTRHELEGTRHELEKTCHEMKETRHGLADAHRDTQSLLHSRSWRITTPLRRLGHMARGARKVVRRFHEIHARHGGMWQVIKRTYWLWRHDSTRLYGWVRGDSALATVDAYHHWIETIESPSLPSPKALASTLKEMRLNPLISIVMPVYNTTEEYLRACIESVFTQSYPHWELCIADDLSSAPHVRPILQEYASRDVRVHVVYRKQNGHISHASNSALEHASGEFVALLDHDDVLPVDALYFMARAINDNPDAMIFYSDEDKIDAMGRRFDPHFKSDWNPDLFFSQNYVSHLGVYRRNILNRIGGFRAGVEGSQDQDLLLRCLLHIRHDQIIHIPRVLYHWRMVEGSTALDSGEKIYTTEAGVKSIKDYFSEKGTEGMRVDVGVAPNTYRVQWPIQDPAPLVSLLIPTRDRKSITEVAVCSILEKTTYLNYEIILLDNGSVEAETLEWFTAIQCADERVRVIRYDHPFNYSAINNFGVKHARGSLIGLINNDVEVISPDWLTEMVSHALRKDIGCVGAKLYYSNGSIQHGGVVLGLGGVAGHSHKHYGKDQPGYFFRLKLIQNLSAVTAACLIVRKEVYQEVGGLNETDLAVAFNDVDFCLKVRQAGYRNLWTPYAELYHHESVSRGAEDTPEKVERFRKEVQFMKSKWGRTLMEDPYYNPNLTKDREDFSIASKLSSPV